MTFGVYKIQEVYSETSCRSDVNEGLKFKKRITRLNHVIMEQSWSDCDICTDIKRRKSAMEVV